MMSGCTKMTSDSMKATLDYGSAPKNYQAIVQNYLTGLDNFHNYRIVKAPPFKHCSEVTTLFESIPKHGWAIDVELELKSYVKPVVDYKNVCYERKGKKKCYDEPVYGNPLLQGYEVTLQRVYIKNNEVMGMELLRHMYNYAE